MKISLDLTSLVKSQQLWIKKKTFFEISISDFFNLNFLSFESTNKKFLYSLKFFGYKLNFYHNHLTSFLKL